MKGGMTRLIRDLRFDGLVSDFCVAADKAHDRM